ncbi:putative uncharacterized protein DDB_G0277255 [Nilaparvata lugens]|nr:putative uncharacterized protein DDB_G0277255 [Nilaparvata lugens]
MSLCKDPPLINQKKSDTTCSINSITETIDNDSDLVSVLKNELKEKDSTLKQLQENYNSLLKKYAEAVNQIDFMRLRNSLNNSYRSDLSVSNEDLTDNNLNYSKNLFPTCHSNNINRCQTEDSTTSLPNRFSSLSNNNKVHEHRPEVARMQKSESLDYKIFNTKQDSTQLPTKEERPQSSSSSTIVSNPQRTKTTLGPISKYYSSSSRLGKKQNVPLPSSKMANSELSPQHSASESHKNALLSTTDHSPLRSYRMRNISKVSPFERVHSYLENFKKMREDSLPTKIDSKGNTSSDESTHEAYTDKNRSKNYTTNQSKLSNRDASRTTTNRSKSEQNLSNHKIFTELSNQNVRSSSGRVLLYSNGGSPTPHTLFDLNRKRSMETYAFQLRGSEKPGKKCSRNLLARGDTFDSHSSLDENFSDDVDGFGHNMEFEKHLSDDSSSISSSIFSLPKDEGYHPPHKNQTSRSETDWKTVSHTKSVKSIVWEKRQSYQTSTIPKRKKGTPDRVCYSPKNRRVPVKKTPSQEDVGLKCRTTPSSNQKSEFHKKLKIYTDILKSKPNRDVGVQVSEQKQLVEPEDSVNVNRLDCLSEASEYLKQMKQGMDRLCDYIENLKVDTGNKRSGSDKL